jgi:sugar phosphate isomerase/epimerase
VLDANWREILEDHQRKLEDFDGSISLHGAFMDLTIQSSDKKIREITTERITQNLEIAEALNAQYIVFHGKFNPLIKNEYFRQHWLERNAEFWSEILGRFSVTVLLENLWEPTPEIFRDLLERVGSERLKICFDIAHVHIFSEVPLEEWIDALQDEFVYVHVSDNKGDSDSELAPGEGNIDWGGFSDLVERKGISPAIVFEVRTLEKTRQSVQYFRERNIYPFNESGRGV